MRSRRVPSAVGFWALPTSSIAWTRLAKSATSAAMSSERTAKRWSAMAPVVEYWLSATYSRFMRLDFESAAVATSRPSANWRAKRNDAG